MVNISALRRPDWLDELHRLLLAATLLAGVGGVLRAGALLAGRPLEADVDTAGVLRPEALIDAPPGVSVSSPLRLQLDHPTGVQYLWEALATLPSHALLVLALALLWRLTGRARRGDPFTADTVGRFRALGLVLAIGGPVTWVVESVSRFAFSATLPVGGPYAPLDFAIPLAWGLCGFGMLAIGEIIRRGQALRAELDGVV